MSNTEINRQIVQQGLDRRAAYKRRMEALLETQERKLRLIINDNHIRATGGYVPQESAQLPQKPKNESSAALARRQEKRAELAQEAAWCADWYRFLLRVFAPFFFAVLAMVLANFDVIHVFLAVPVAIVFALTGIKIFADRYLTIKNIH